MTSEKEKIKCGCGVMFDSADDYMKHAQNVDNIERHSGDKVDEL